MGRASMNDTFQVWGRRWCLFRSVDLPSEDEVHSYCIDSEGIYYACKNTIGTYSQEIAASLSSQLGSNKDADRDKVIVDACLKAAKCKILEKSKDKKKEKSNKQYYAELEEKRKEEL